MRKNVLWFLVLNAFLFLSTACNSKESNSCACDTTASLADLPSDLNGLIVLNTWDKYADGKNQGIYAFEFINGKVKNNRQLLEPFKGINPYAYDRKNITYAEPCSGKYFHHRTKIITEKGLSSAPITPCSSKLIDGYSLFRVAKLSPDKSKLAIQMYNTKNNFIKVFDVSTAREVASYEHYMGPEWHPDGRLLFSSSYENDDKGIYITDKKFIKTTRIDQKKINQSVDYLDVSSSGDKLIFSMSARVWSMDIGNNYVLSNLQDIISEGANIKSPVWSPEGDYIAYLSAIDGVSARKVTFWHVDSKKSYVFDTKTIFPVNTYGTHWMTPKDYLSWVK